MNKAMLPQITEAMAARLHITFGRHRGKLVTEVPTAYLQWMAEHFNPDPGDCFALAAAVMELKRRNTMESLNGQQ